MRKTLYVILGASTLYLVMDIVMNVSCGLSVILQKVWG